MQINRDRLYLLLQAYISETITAAELDELARSMQQAGTDEDVNAVVDEIWEGLDMEKLPEIRGDAMYSKVINDPRVRADRARRSIRVVKRPGRFAWRMAGALALLCLAAAVFLHYNKSGRPDTAGAMVNAAGKQVITPGGKKALLTLADGRNIILDDIGNGKIAEQSGVLISKTEKGQIVYEAQKQRGSVSGHENYYNTIATPRGGEYQLVLPDGTKVWLNAASSLKYPAHFNGTERKVELTGEAYFEVSREPFPFIVKTASQEVKVLGTHFNIRAYDDEDATKTTLLEGKVSVRQPSASSVILEPGQQASSEQGSKRIAVNAIDTEEAMAWKNGYFFFQNEDIRSVMNTIARWYDVDIEYHGDMNGKVFAGTISRFESFEKLLQTIALTGSVRFEIQGRRIIVMS